MFNGCEFCLQIERHYTLRNRIIYQSRNFTIWPSLGPVADGHILIMPNTHRTAFLEFNPGELIEFSELLEIYLQKYHRLGLSILIGEHGNQPMPNTMQEEQANVFAPACVAHAHIHLIALPMNFDKLLEIYLSELGKPSFEASNIEELVGKPATSREYVLASDGNNRWLLWANVPTVESQLVRRVASTAIGAPERFNWREYPSLDNVERIASELAALFESHPSNVVPSWGEEQSKYDLGGGFAKD